MLTKREKNTKEGRIERKRGASNLENRVVEGRRI